jgi:Methyltransferase domain
MKNLPQWMVDDFEEAQKLKRKKRKTTKTNKVNKQTTQTTPKPKPKPVYVQQYNDELMSHDDFVEADGNSSHGSSVVFEDTPLMRHRKDALIIDSIQHNPTSHQRPGENKAVAVAVVNSMLPVSLSQSPQSSALHAIPISAAATEAATEVEAEVIVPDTPIARYMDSEVIPATPHAQSSTSSSASNPVGVMLSYDAIPGTPQRPAAAAAAAASSSSVINCTQSPQCRHRPEATTSPAADEIAANASRVLESSMDGSGSGAHILVSLEPSMSFVEPVVRHVSTPLSLGPVPRSQGLPDDIQFTSQSSIRPVTQPDSPIALTPWSQCSATPLSQQQYKQKHQQNHKQQQRRQTREVKSKPIDFSRGNYTPYFRYRNWKPVWDVEDQRIHEFEAEWLQGKSCLDIGCGTGILATALAYRFGVKLMCGIDQSPQLIELAQLLSESKRHQVFGPMRHDSHNGPMLRFTCSDVIKIPDPLATLGQFDVVLWYVMCTVYLCVYVCAYVCVYVCVCVWHPSSDSSLSVPSVSVACL